MSDAEWTTDERRWINRLRRVSNDKPRDVRVYVLDGNCLYICKAGVPCDELSADVPLRVSPGCVLTDIHDDCNNGLA